jgi:hypothetical protein
MAEETRATPATAPKQQRQPKLRYQDRPEINEAFTDSIRSCVFDGHVMRIEFTVARFDDPGALGVLEGRQVPVARLVLNRNAVGDLFNRLQQLSQAIKQAGVPTDKNPGANAPASSTKN